MPESRRSGNDSFATVRPSDGRDRSDGRVSVVYTVHGFCCRILQGVEEKNRTRKSMDGIVGVIDD